MFLNQEIIQFINPHIRDKIPFHLLQMPNWHFVILNNIESMIANQARLFCRFMEVSSIEIPIF